jgi:CDP-glucose 4,6-dehydratase
VKIPVSVAIDPDFWPRRRVLVTGHTGFKGAWLSLWLTSLGAEVTGLAPGVPTSPSLFEQARVGEQVQSVAVDVRDAAAVRRAVEESAAEVVFHLAAQPMVRRSLREPALTYEVNVIGTVNVLEAARLSETVRSVVIVTSDKCYENRGEGRPFVEGDPLGGSDPYSSSKACAELVTASYRSSLLAPDGPTRVASARAGNVIGGGDWGEDRLLPDALRAVERGESLLVRNPAAVRPWQHVLNPLAGYLTLARRLWDEPAAARAWNLGPPDHDARPVGWIVERLAELWRGELSWGADEGPNPPEAELLTLDSGDAIRELGWRFAWELEEGLERVVGWHRAQRSGEDMRAYSLAQIAAFTSALSAA